MNDFTASLITPLKVRIGEGCEGCGHVLFAFLVKNWSCLRFEI